MEMEQIIKGVISSAIYGILGIILMGIGFLVVNLVTPFSVKKEIEKDQNTSLGIIIDGIIIGISIIVSSAIISIEMKQEVVIKSSNVTVETGNKTTTIIKDKTTKKDTVKIK